MKIIAAVPFPLENGGEIIPANEPGFHNKMISTGSNRAVDIDGNY